MATMLERSTMILTGVLDRAPTQGELAVAAEALYAVDPEHYAALSNAEKVRIIPTEFYKYLHNQWRQYKAFVKKRTADDEAQSETETEIGNSVP